MWYLKKSDKGFTLIELLIVVAIIGILAAIAIPQYINARNDARNKATVASAEAVIGELTTEIDYQLRAQNATPATTARGCIFTAGCAAIALIRGATTVHADVNPEGNPVFDANVPPTNRWQVGHATGATEMIAVVDVLLWDSVGGANLNPPEWPKNVRVD